MQIRRLAVLYPEYGATANRIKVTDYDYDYTNNDCIRLRLYGKIITITIVITVYATQT